MYRMKLTWVMVGLVALVPAFGFAGGGGMGGGTGGGMGGGTAGGMGGAAAASSSGTGASTGGAAASGSAASGGGATVVVHRQLVVPTATASGYEQATSDAVVEPLRPERRQPAAASLERFGRQ